jgi:hypothetical protein
MRSTTSSHRRLHGRPDAPPELSAIAALVDELAIEEPGHLLVHVLHEPGPDVALGTKALDGATHPFVALAGFSAPAEWSAFGLRVRGRARLLDQPQRPPQATRTTFLVDRRGREASLLRQGDTTTELPGPAEGTIPDLCRRVLGLPTDPPPAPTTRALWITMWLDRILAAWSDPGRRREVTAGWCSLAALHPALDGHGASPSSTAGPAELIALARAHTERWSWAQLRAEPGTVLLPDGALPLDITSWMDDGFYARWALGAFPRAEDLVADVLSLLPEPLRTQLRATLVELLQP